MECRQNRHTWRKIHIFEERDVFPHLTPEIKGAIWMTGITSKALSQLDGLRYSGTRIAARNK